VALCKGTRCQRSSTTPQHTRGVARVCACRGQLPLRVVQLLAQCCCAAVKRVLRRGGVCCCGRLAARLPRGGAAAQLGQVVCCCVVRGLQCSGGGATHSAVCTSTSCVLCCHAGRHLRAPASTHLQRAHLLGLLQPLQLQAVFQRQPLTRRRLARRRQRARARSVGGVLLHRGVQPLRHHRLVLRL
jgi:hypothetical protein